jgi:hypothetical protein
MGALMFLTVMLVAAFVNEPIVKQDRKSAGAGQTLQTIDQLRA